MRRTLTLFSGFILMGTAFLQAAEKRDQMVREDRKTFQQDSTWIYNDLPKALEAARKSQKPLLIVFR